MIVALDREKLGKVLALFASPVDGEALAAVRMAVKLLAAAGIRPEQLMAPVPVVHEPAPVWSPVWPSEAPAYDFRDPFENVREYYSRHRRSQTSVLSFANIGPGEARARLRKLLASSPANEPRGFLEMILDRLGNPHKARFTRTEIRRLDEIWYSAVAAGKAAA